MLLRSFLLAACALALAAPARAQADGLEAPVTYAARDSVRIVLVPRGADADTTAPPDDRLSLFGDARATYEGATLRAARLEYRTGLAELRARPVEGDTVGTPRFSDGSESFSGRELAYNLSARRGRIVGARTAIDDGYLLGGVIKQVTDDIVYARDAAYTTCDLDRPHYAMTAGRIKVEDGERVYTGPVRLTLLGLPTPIILPFGFFPAQEGRRSGPLPLRPGTDNQYGVFLDNVGYYWAINDYLDAQASGKLGSRGSYDARGQVRYAKRYAYTGNLAATYGRIPNGESSDPGFSESRPASVNWTHRQTFPDGQTLNASVALSSRSQRFISDDLDDQVSQSSTSTVAYNQSWAGVGRSLGLSARAYQDFAQGQTTLTLPTLSLNQQRRFPLRRGRDDQWYESIGLSYSADATNTYQFSPLSDSTGVSFVDGLFDGAAFTRATGDDQRFAYTVNQSVPLSASFKVPRFNLNLTPSVTFRETWAGARAEQTYFADRDSVGVTQVPGFTAVRQVTPSLRADTEFYGTFPLRIGPVDGFRHTVTPSVTLRATPDYAGAGFIREVQTNAEGDTRRYAIVNGIPLEATRSLGVNIGNTFLARVARTDTTGTVTRESVQVLSLSVGGGYNFVAEERPFQDVRVSATSQFYGINARANATYSAYALSETGAVTGETVLDATGRPLRLSNVTASANRAFSSGGGGRAPDLRAVRRPVALQGEPYDPTNPAYDSRPVGYLDYSAPWSFALDLTLSHRPGSPGSDDNQTTATLGLTGLNARLTPNWSLTGSTGLDLAERDITQTAIGLRRDLHCWELAIDWQPIGVTRGFGFSIYVKSGLLRDFLRFDPQRRTTRSLPF